MKCFNSFKKRLVTLLGLSITLILFSYNSFAQPTYFNNNTGGTANSFPFNIGSAGSNKVQWLYRNTYFPTASSGLITDIYFRTTATPASFTLTGVEIRMGQSTLATFPSGTYITGLSLVYTSASVTVTKLAGGWVRFTLQTPFLYDNTKNFIVEAIGQNVSALTMAQNNAAATGRIFGNYLSATGTSGTGLVDFGFDLQPKKGMNNASVASIANPTSVFCSGNLVPVSVNVKNTGFNRINNVKVFWILDGGTPSVVNWTTLIDTIGSVAGNNAVINLGNVLFGSVPRTFKIYTSVPNGIADTVNNDDTLSVTLGAGLNGIYTIGGAAPDYPDVMTAANALNNYGVCGPVTFNIRPGVYVGAVNLKSISGSSPVNRITFQPEDASPTSVTLTYSAATANDNYVVNLGGTSYTTFKKLKMTATGATFGTVMNINNNAVGDSIFQCALTTSLVNNANFNIMQLASTTGTCDDWVIRDNVFNNGFCGISAVSASTATPFKNMLIENNRFNNTARGILITFYTDLKVRNNIMNSTSTSDIGIQLTNTGVIFSPVEIINNAINDLPAGTAYNLVSPCGSTGTPSTALRSRFINNIASVNGTGTATNSGLILTNPSNMDVYNNTISVNNTSTASIAANLNFSTAAAFANNNIMNNAFTNTGGGGTAITTTNVAAANGNVMDYNNIYTNGSGNFGINNGTSYANFTLWRNANAQNKNTLCYTPGYTSSINLIPDANNPASWSLNGRGKQLVAVTKDITGAARPVTLAAGVPDIGAYEFEPTSTPPDAIAIPAIATPGTKQYFTFGFDTVATVTWNPNVPVTSPLSVKQYSGRKAPGFNAVSPNRFMYFYTDISSGGTTYSFNTDVYYKDTWLGTMGTEANIKLAHKYLNTSWMAYSGSLSSANVTRNMLTAFDLTSFGMYTGIDTNILSAIVKPKSTTIICTGNTVVLKSNTGVGYTYQWNNNGTPITGANNDSLVVSAAGDYTVTITSGSNSATSIPIAVTVVPPPMALATASGPLTYCTGSNLQLNAGTGPGLTYQWQINGNNITGATANTYNVIGPGSYTVVVKNIACGNTSPVVVVTSGPLNVSLGTDTTFCEVKNQAFVLNAGYPGAKYRWSTGDTTQSISIFKGSGAFSVLVDAGPNCIDRDTINVVVKPLPNITGISFIGSGTNYTFNTAGAQNASSFLWMFADGTTSTQTQVTKNFPDGNVIVKLVAFNECGSDTSVLINWATNVNTTNAEGYSLSLYPNPAKEKCTVSVEGNVFITDVTLLNAVGQVVYKTTLEANAKSHTIDVARFAAGHYILRANTTNGTVAKSMNIDR